MSFDPSAFDSAVFLRDYWQKRPLLIRNPWQRWTNPLEPDELAGLACEPEVESRLVVQEGAEARLEHGPLPEDRFGRLGQAPWTLLVQAVDQHVPEVAALLEPFRFIPNWRIDDVMVSYAVDGGGVGPHYDQYDVFLVQGLGRRRWQIGAACDESTALQPHDGLRLLQAFEPLEEWVLEPGDMLYLPPRVAHDGVALGDDCMTYSIGFRAPSRRELIEGWAQEALAALDDDDRYADPDLAPQANPGEITAASIERARQMLVDRLSDAAGFARWFAAHATTPRNPEIEWDPETPFTANEIRDAAAGGATVLRNPASRFAFVREEGGLMLFVNGEGHLCTGAAAGWAERIAARPSVALEPALAHSDPAIDLLVKLFNQGHLAFEEDD
jgi:50S ribosomal protein L16 3-hydroxylase